MHPYSEWTIVLVFLVIEVVVIVRNGSRLIETLRRYREGEEPGRRLVARVIIFILILAVIAAMNTALLHRRH